jgi:two-component system, NtrC family, sensor kinase
VKLAGKLSIALIFAVCVVMGVYAYFKTRDAIVLADVDLERTRWFCKGRATAVQELWREEGEARAMQFVATADRGNPTLGIRWIWVDAPAADAHGADLSDAARRTLAEGRSITIEREARGTLHEHTYVPMTGPGGRLAAIEYSESLEGKQTYLRKTHLGLILTTVLIALICGLVALWLGVWLVGRPVALLRDKARRIAAGDFSGRLALRQNDEIGELAAEIDAMSDRIRDAREELARETEARIAAVEQLRHADRLATIGQLASGVAHELGTPLNVIAARGKMIAGAGAWSDAVRQHARIVTEQAERMTGIIHQLLDLSRQRRPKLGRADLQRIVARTLELVSAAAASAGVNVIVEGRDTVALVEADQGQLEQALTNLVLNGIQAMPEGGRLTVRVERRPARPQPGGGGREGEYVVLTVADEGVGIAPEDLPRIFEPFFTTKGTGEGTGLGLPVVSGIVAEHGGWIEVESAVGSGTRFRVFLRPAVQPELRLVGTGS